MSKHFHDQLFTGDVRIVPAPEPMPRHQVEVDRNFELPIALYAATAACYVTFLVVMAAALAAPGLIVPMAICAVFLIGFFTVPAAWTRMRANASKPMTMGQFEKDGIMTHTGPLAPRDAAIQMLILPVLIVFWACAAATIIALV